MPSKCLLCVRLQFEHKTSEVFSLFFFFLLKKSFQLAGAGTASAAQRLLKRPAGRSEGRLLVPASGGPLSMAGLVLQFVWQKLKSPKLDLTFLLFFFFKRSNIAQTIVLKTLHDFVFVH